VLHSQTRLWIDPQPRSLLVRNTKWREASQAVHLPASRCRKAEAPARGPERRSRTTLDGDGVADLVYVEDQRLTLWIQPVGCAKLPSKFL
jgi:hypothetical protein